MRLSATWMLTRPLRFAVLPVRPVLLGDPAARVDAVFDLLGDYDGDGITTPDNNSVEANDYVIWRDTQGSITDLRADGNDDAHRHAADYNFWSSNFNNTLSLDCVLVVT